MTILIAIPAVQLLTQDVNKELQKRVWNAAKHLQWSLFAKSSVTDVWLGSKYASQSTFNDTTFILELIFIRAFQSFSI